MDRKSQEPLVEVNHLKKNRVALTTWEYTDSKTKKTFKFDDHKKALKYMANRFDAWSLAAEERKFVWEEVRHFKIFSKPSKKKIAEKLKKKEYALKDTGSTLKMSKKVAFKRRNQDINSKKKNWW